MGGGRVYCERQALALLNHYQHQPSHCHCPKEYACSSNERGLFSHEMTRGGVDPSDRRPVATNL